LAYNIVRGVQQSHARRIQAAWRGHRARTVNVPRRRIEKAKRNWAPGGSLYMTYIPSASWFGRPTYRGSKSASPRRNRSRFASPKRNRPRSA
jgi:hypothetical protein